MKSLSTKLLSLAIISCALFYVWADPKFPAHLVGTFSRSNLEPKYKIEFHPEDAPFHPDDDQESIVVPYKNGQQFLCFVPMEEKAKSVRSTPQQNISSVIMEPEKRVKLKTPDELLEPLSHNKCLLRGRICTTESQDGWWFYEFCHRKGARQFHLEENKIVQEFVLGFYDADATADFNQNRSDISSLQDPRSKDASQRYHSHIFKNGTKCDLTSQPREVEVRFVCADTSAMISSITELSTCKYALTVQSPTLCKHPLFQQERPTWYTIHCSAIPKEDAAAKTQGER